MSYNKKISKQVLKPHCKLCFEAGRPDFEHWTSNYGVVICEYLKGLKCLSCGELGHTPKYCTNPIKTPEKNIIKVPEKVLEKVPEKVLEKVLEKVSDTDKVSKKTFREVVEEYKGDVSEFPEISEGISSESVTSKSVASKSIASESVTPKSVASESVTPKSIASESVAFSSIPGKTINILGSEEYIDAILKSQCISIIYEYIRYLKSPILSNIMNIIISLNSDELNVLCTNNVLLNSKINEICYSLAKEPIFKSYFTEKLPTENIENMEHYITAFKNCKLSSNDHLEVIYKYLKYNHNSILSIKITGMFGELDKSEIKLLYDDIFYLHKKVNEACDILREEEFYQIYFFKPFRV